MDRDRRDRDRDRDKERDRDRSSLRPNGGRHSDRYPGNHHPVNGPRGGYSDGYNRNFNGPPPHHHGHNQPFGGGGGGGGGGPPFRPVGGGGYAGPMSGRKRDSGGGFASSGRGHSPDRSDGGRFVKLFVGSVPRTATEDDIRPLFEEHGYVLEVAIVKDRRTGQQQGFCFVKYATQEEADRAIRSLHNQVTLLGGLGPIQVKYADAEKDRIGKFQGTSFQSASEPKLFVATLNKHATEKEVEEIFAPYGHVEDVYLMKDDFKQSRGCGFVRFSNRDMAVAAMNALNGTYVMRGCEQPIVVRFAEPKRPRGGDSRPGPTFGGPGFGPRSQQPPPIRSSSNMGDFEHGSSSPWHPMSPHHGVPSSQFSSNAFVGSAGSLGGPTSVNNSLPNMNAALSTSQQGFNSSMPPLQPFGQPMPPLQMLQQPSSVHLQPQLTSPFPQMQSSQTPIPQLNPMQLAQPGGPVPLPNLSVPAGISGQQSVSQPQPQPQPQPLQAGLQSSLNISSQQQLQSNISTSGPNCQNPQLLQPLQQVASQVRPQQQSPAVPSGFHSIPQQAFPQPQQQLHLMQRQPSTQIQQHNLQATSKPQTSWNAITPQTMGSSAAAPSTVAAPTGLSSTAMAASVTPIASLTCNWTEHTSPEGYKYYYNSVTSESKWEKPEELALFEQQQLQQKLLLQQQQKLVVQPMQSQMQGQPLPQALSNQQTSQVQQTQIQVHPRQPQQLQIQQPSMYHGSATSGQHNVQGVSYSQPMGNNLVTEPSRLQQGLQSTTQEWMWKNKPTGN